MTLEQKNYDPAIMAGAADDISEYALAEGSVAVGSAAGLASALDAKTSGQILVGDGTTVASVAVSGDATLASTGVLTIAAGAVTYAKRSVVGAATATADGLTTGLILAGETFVTVTSDSATKFVTLPACAEAGIGQTIDIYVGANGYELVTPASSGDTISTVDSDQTNQLDVAANSLLRLIQVSATGWFAYQVTATTITVVAPDND
jgi:hypothetical protein